MIGATQPARYAVVTHPMQIDIAPHDLLPVPAGATFADLAPRYAAGYVCALVAEDMPRGGYLSRVQWGIEPRPGDIIVFHRRSLGGDGSNPLRIILSLAVLYFAPYLATELIGINGAAALGAAGVSAVTAGIAIAGQMLVNALVPLQAANLSSQGGASPTYNIALQGNTARLEQPRPVLYGHNRTFPDFAAQSYSLFIAQDQYYHACFFVSEGNLDILRVSVDDTPLQHFADVEWFPVGPGQSTGRWDDGVETLADQTLVATNIVSAPEVSGQDMLTNQPVGPFCATGPEQSCVSIGIDVVLPRGLSDGLSISWQVEARQIDDYEKAIGPWQTIGVHTQVGQSFTPVRLSNEYTVDSGRYQVRLTRSDVASTDPVSAHHISWAGMRATLDTEGVTNTTGTYVVMKIRASEQLSGLSSRRISVLSNRLIPVWDGSAWAGPEFTRNPAWVCADILRNSVYGRGLADDSIDLETFQALAETWDARQDHYDGAFDTLTTIWDALSDVARVGRAVPQIRGSRYTLIRDEQQTTPVAMYTPRNTRRGTFRLDFSLPTVDQIDAIDLEYYDHRRWDWVQVTGQVQAQQIHVYRGDTNRPSDVTEPANRVRVRVPGIIGENHAKREVAYRVADAVWRRQRASIGAELDGLLPAFGSLVALSHDVPQWGSYGDVWSYDEDTLTLSTTEPLEWREPGTRYMRLQKPSGELTSAIAVTRGASDSEAVLAEDPGFDLITDAANQDRTRYVFGIGQDVGALCRVVGIVPRGETSIDLSLVLEDNRVHAADNEWLPHGETQDELNDGEAEGAEESGIIIGRVILGSTGSLTTTVDLDVDPPSATGSTFYPDAVLPFAPADLEADQPWRMGLVPWVVDPGYDHSDYGRFWGDMRSMNTTAEAVADPWQVSVTTQRGSPNPLGNGNYWYAFIYSGTPPTMSATLLPTYLANGVQLDLFMTGYVRDWWFLTNNGVDGCWALDENGARINMSRITLDKRLTVSGGLNGGTLHVALMDGLGRKFVQDLTWAAQP